MWRGALHLSDVQLRARSGEEKTIGRHRSQGRATPRAVPAESTAREGGKGGNRACMLRTIDTMDFDRRSSGSGSSPGHRTVLVFSCAD